MVIYKLEVKMKEEIYQILEDLSKRWGHRNQGHTLEEALRLLKLVTDALEKGLMVGTLKNDKGGIFTPWLFSEVKTVKKDDEFLGKVLKCENCQKEFRLEKGLVYRENPEPEGMRHIDCVHCGYNLDF